MSNDENIEKKAKIISHINSLKLKNKLNENVSECIHSNLEDSSFLDKNAKALLSQLDKDHLFAIDILAAIYRKSLNFISLEDPSRKHLESLIRINLDIIVNVRYAIASRSTLMICSMRRAALESLATLKYLRKYPEHTQNYIDYKKFLKLKYELSNKIITQEEYNKQKNSLNLGSGNHWTGKDKYNLERLVSKVELKNLYDLTYNIDSSIFHASDLSKSFYDKNGFATPELIVTAIDNLLRLLGSFFINLSEILEDKTNDELKVISNVIGFLIEINQHSQEFKYANIEHKTV